MYLKKFSVDTTNLYPAANSKMGGQLTTEFNIRARDSVYAPESVKYINGPNYVHSETDYQVNSVAGESAYFPDETATGGTQLIISPGRAIINGFYVENLVPMIVDMLEINAALVDEGEEPMAGQLAIGLKVMFSTEQTMSGSILVEDNTGYYQGIQIVVLPADQMLLPTSKVIIDGVEIDCGLPENQNRVTADLLLANFTYINGSINNIRNNYPGKCQMMPASRIGNIDDIISKTYVSKAGLNPKRLYTFAGKGTDPATGQSTWCDSTDSLVIWDKTPQYTMYEPEATEFTFQRSTTDPDVMQMVLPHKQVDGMTDGEGRPQYYAPRLVDLPVAEWGSNSPGLVSPSYTQSVKEISNKINDLMHLTNGKQRAFLTELTDRANLPNLDPTWEVGDYVLVARDSTIISELNDTLNLTPPSTMYVVLPGVVTEIGTARASHPNGVNLDTYVTEWQNDPDNPQSANNDWFNISSGMYRGVVGEDYFTLKLTHTNDRSIYSYYTVTATNGLKSYSEPMQLTGQYPFATEQLTGGFLNAPESYIDGGYVYLDDTGHLRLRDYSLLRSGTLAYQLAENYTVDAGLTVDEIQAELDEYVNQRIAFPNLVQSLNSDNNVITITITLPAESEGENPLLEIYDLDSRFSTAVAIEIYGEATSATTINISDCEKIKVTLHSGTPKINLYRSCLYYDAATLNILNDIVDMSLWYEKLQNTDPDLVVEGMTVSVASEPFTVSDPNYNVIASEYWTAETPNDNHFTVGLQSITFGSNGVITGCGILIRNDSTANIIEGRQIFHDTFELPQGPDLYYPVGRLNQPVKVTGRFVSAYTSQSPEGYVVMETDFSLVTPSYLPITQTQTTQGEIALLVNSYTLSVANPSAIDVWDTASFHHFEGTTLI